MTQLNQERYPPTFLQESLFLPPAPSTQDELLQYVQVLHTVINDNQLQTARAVNELAYHRATVSTPDDESVNGGTGSASPPAGLPDSLPDAVGSGVIHAAIDASGDTGRLFVDLPTTRTWVEIASKHSDSNVSLSGSHTGLLSGASTVADAMVVLDDLDGGDITLGFTPDGLLFGQTLVGDALGVIDDWNTNGIIFDNNANAIRAKNAANTATLDVLKLNASDQAEFGMDAILQNGDYLLGKTSTVDAYLIGVNASNQVYVGSGSFQTHLTSGGILGLNGVTGIDLNPGTGSVYIDGGGLLLDNNEAYLGKATGGTSRNIGKVNTSDETEIGDSALPLSLVSDGTIDCHGADLTAVESTDAASRKTQKSATLTDTVWLEVFRLFVDANSFAAATLFFSIKAVSSLYTKETYSGYVPFAASRDNANSVTDETGSTFGTSGNLGGALFQVAGGTAAVDHLRCRVKWTTALAGATITGEFSIVQADGATITWSI